MNPTSKFDINCFDFEEVAIAHHVMTFVLALYGSIVFEVSVTLVHQQSVSSYLHHLEVAQVSLNEVCRGIILISKNSA